MRTAHAVKQRDSADARHGRVEQEQKKGRSQPENNHLYQNRIHNPKISICVNISTDSKLTRNMHLEAGICIVRTAIDMTTATTTLQLDAHESDSRIATTYNESAIRLDRLPVGAFHFRIMAIIAAGLFVESSETFLAGSVLAALQKSGWSNFHLTSVFVSVTFAGLLAGGWMAGLLGDHFGRKKGYQINLLIFGGAAFAAFFAPNMNALIALRFVMGIGLGAELVLGYSALAEFVPPHTRGRLSAIMSFISHGGGFAASFCGAWVIPHLGWRYMFMIAAVGSGIVWFFRRYMPESPRWLESKSRIAEAREVLDQIERIAYSGEKPPPLPADQTLRVQNTLPPAKVKARELFSNRYLRSTCIGLLVMVTMQVCLYGLVTWLPTFFVSQGHTMEDALRWNAIVSIGQPISGILLIIIIDKVGRKVLLAGAAVLAVAFSPFYLMSSNQPVFMMLATGFVFMMLAQILMTVGQGTYLSEIFPTKLRSRGVGLTSSVSRGLQIGVQIAVPAIYTAYKMSGILIAVDIVLVIFAICLCTFGAETRRRSLEHIEN
ncbi:MFS transporter [Burkholderia sp. MR1-5-21]